MQKEKALRVLYVFGAVADGGVEHIATELVKNMDRKRVHVSAVYHNCVVPEGVESIPVLHELWPHMDKAPNFNTVNALSYRKWWKTYIDTHDKFDIVHLHYVDSAFCYLDLFRKKGTITIGHSHNPHARPFTLGLFWSCIISFPARYLCDYAFGCSHQAAKDIFGMRMIKSGRCRVLYNGIHLEEFKYNPDIRKNIRQNNHIEDNIFVIGLVGRFEKQKNHEFLLKVFSEFYKNHDSSELWLIGTGSLYEKSIELANELGIANAVRFLGQVKNVNEYLQAFDCFVMPSNYEGLSLAIVEAQVSGLPCIVSDAIQFDSDIGAGLLSVLSLRKNSVVEWSNTIHNTMSKERKDCCVYARNTGFDIMQIGKWLMEFYDKITDSQNVTK